ncbi:unnamed protein product [Allacma fusca]|uniref:Uncharacterized protein n=1 Tax=Allacma fusca TaxID=39272 RepID=A0A8J2K2A0_9HEXA|nr:unnamed protein product [Allacma fusca]
MEKVEDGKGGSLSQDSMSASIYGKLCRKKKSSVSFPLKRKLGPSWEASGGEKAVYKRVAVVEHFFDIIYTVHVETEAKNGKHAGQKRTYRAVSFFFQNPFWGSPRLFT